MCMCISFSIQVYLWEVCPISNTPNCLDTQILRWGHAWLISVSLWITILVWPWPLTFELWTCHSKSHIIPPWSVKMKVHRHGDEGSCVWESANIYLSDRTYRIFYGATSVEYHISLFFEACGTIKDSIGSTVPQQEAEHDCSILPHTYKHYMHMEAI